MNSAGTHEDELGPVDDPYLAAESRLSVRPSGEARTSGLAVASFVALLLGPVGPVCSIVFGWAARREIDRGGPRRGRALATASMALGAVLTMAWGAVLGLYAFGASQGAELTQVDLGEGPTGAAVDAPDAPDAPDPPDPAADPGAQAMPGVAPPAGSPGGRAIPRETRIHHSGSITIVDIGASTSSLEEELARQRAAAAEVGETVLVMTTRDDCEPCRGVDRALGHALMQTALATTRLVRVDVDAFKEDLDALKMPRNRYPSFFLLSLDLTPKDGIDGGEWDADVAQNIAPVLGAFVRGKYQSRRREWQPLPGTGVRL